MSFLLRAKNRQRNWAPGPGNPVPSRSKPSMLTTSKPAANMRSSGGGQVQQLVQRQRPQLHQKSLQRNAPKQQQQNQGQQEAIQEVISMEEVMEDLRVLEQQQRESQRKLATIKLTKQHKQNQKTSLETKLASLKYANGQRRAQLTRAREVLHKSSCQMGTAKLRSDNSGANLKDFDNRLKIALASARSMQVLRRKNDGGLILMRNKDSVMKRLIMECFERGKALEKEHESLENHEHSLRRTIQENNHKTKLYMDETSKVRMEISGLEEDLASAKQMEASTKLRAESIAAEIESEGKRHADNMQAMRAKIEQVRLKKSALGNQKKSIEECIESKAKETHSLWNHVVKIQRVERLPLSLEPVDGAPLPFLDADFIRQIVNELDTQVKIVEADKATVLSNFEQQAVAMAELQAEALATKEEADTVRQATEATLKMELERRENSTQLVVELETERKIVADLRKAVAELEAAQDDDKCRLEQHLLDRADDMHEAKTKQDQSRQEIAEFESTIHLLTESWDSVKTEYAAKIRHAEQVAEKARIDYEAARQEVSTYEQQAKDELRRELEEVERAQNMMIEETQTEIIKILNNHPKLAELDIAYDPNKSLDHRIEELLVDLKDECDAHIVAASRELEERKQEQRAKAAESRRKAMEQKRIAQLLIAEQDQEREAKEKSELAARKKAEREKKEQDRNARKEAEREARIERDLRREEKQRSVRKKAEREAKEQERKARKQAEQEASDERERRDCCEEAERVAASSLVELSDPNFVDFIEAADAESSDEDIEVGCLTQREGLSVPTPKSKDKLTEERPRSDMRVRWEGLDDVGVSDDVNADTKQSIVGGISFVNTSPLSVDDQGHESPTAFGKAPNRRKKVKTAYGSSRERKTVSSSSSKNMTLVASCPVKQKDMSCEFSRAKETFSTSKHNRPGNADTFTGQNHLPSVETSSHTKQTSSSSRHHIADDDSRTKRKVHTSSSATSAHVKEILSSSLRRSRGDESRTKRKELATSSEKSSHARESSSTSSVRHRFDYEESRTKREEPSSLSDRIFDGSSTSIVDGKMSSSIDPIDKLLKTSASRLYPPKLPSSSCSSKNVASKRSSSSKKDADKSHRVLKKPVPEEHLPDFLAPSVSHTSSKSVSSSRNRDEKAKSVHNGRALQAGASSSRSSDSRPSGKKRCREPDLSAYTQTSGISSGERSSLNNKSRRRKKTLSSIGAAVVNDASQITKVKSQKALSALGGGFGDYDFAF